MQLSLASMACTSDAVVTLDAIRAALPPGYHTCIVVERPIITANTEADVYRDWDTMVAAGKSYLVGQLTRMDTYLRQYTSPIKEPWMTLAYLWARQNPACHLEIDSSHRDAHGFREGGSVWNIGERGDYVQIVLPVQDCGGEKHWISRDGKSRLLVGED